MKNNVVIRDNKSNLFISSSFYESKVAGIFNLYKTYKTVSGLFVIVLCKKKCLTSSGLLSRWGTVRDHRQLFLQVYMNLGDIPTL